MVVEVDAEDALAAEGKVNDMIADNELEDRLASSIVVTDVRVQRD